MNQYASSSSSPTPPPRFSSSVPSSSSTSSISPPNNNNSYNSSNPSNNTVIVNNSSDVSKRTIINNRMNQVLLCLPVLRQIDSCIKKFWNDIRKGPNNVPMNKLFEEMLEPCQRMYRSSVEMWKRESDGTEGKVGAVIPQTRFSWPLVIDRINYSFLFDCLFQTTWSEPIWWMDRNFHFNYHKLFDSMQNTEQHCIYVCLNIPCSTMIVPFSKAHSAALVKLLSSDTWYLLLFDVNTSLKMGWLLVSST